MTLAEANGGAREATAAVAVVQRPPDGRGDRARAGVDLDDPAVPAVAHDDPAGVAGQALGRSSWNVCPVLKSGLAGGVGVGEDLGVDMDDDLVALTGVPGIEAEVKGGLGEERQSVGLALLHRRRVGVGVLLPTLLVQRLPGSVERLHEQGAHFRRQPSLDPHRAVTVRIHVESAAGVLQGRVAGLGLAVDPSPAADDARDMRGGPGPPRRAAALRCPGWPRG
jgi:hypothetical protein